MWLLLLLIGKTALPVTTKNEFIGDGTESIAVPLVAAPHPRETHFGQSPN
jgi:hypothetical protein